MSRLSQSDFQKKINKPPYSAKAARSEILQLASQVAEGKSVELIADIMSTALRLGEDSASIADLKLFRKAFAEMRYASCVFDHYNHKRKVAVFGSARTAPESDDFKLAIEFAEKMVRRGYMIITGGGDGIMGAAQQGAGADNSFGLNIELPFEQQANETIEGDPKLINFKYFFTRKLHFLKETQAVILFPGGFGTQDEGFESLTLMQTGKSQIVPMVMIEKVNGHYWETWRRFVEHDLLGSGLISENDLHLFKITHSADEAVEEVAKFYSNFNSYRWVKDRMVIRLEQALTEKAVEDLNNKFSSLLVRDKIEQMPGPLPEERNAFPDLPRLVLVPDKHNFGLIRLLIDAINNAAKANPQ
ncbi:MAG: TIGR00730 family Rossman fold protein [Chthoniobacterales bacterium]